MNRILAAVTGAVWSLFLLEPGVFGAARSKDWRESAAFTATAEDLRGAWQAVPAEFRNDVAVLWAETAYTLDGQGRATVRRRVVYGLPRAALGDDSAWDTVRVGWAPWYQQRPTVRARSLTPDGRFRDLDLATVSERPAERWDNVFSDARILEAPLPGMADGTIVEVETVLRDREPYFPAGTAYRESLLTAPYVLAGRLTVGAASDLPLHWKVEGTTSIRSVERAEKRSRKLHFDYERLSSSGRLELATPPAQLPEPTIGFSTARDWTSVAKAYAAIVESKLAGLQLGPFLAGAAKTLPRDQAIDLVHRRRHDRPGANPGHRLFRSRRTPGS